MTYKTYVLGAEKEVIQWKCIVCNKSFKFRQWFETYNFGTVSIYDIGAKKKIKR